MTGITERQEESDEANNSGFLDELNAQMDHGYQQRYPHRPSTGMQIQYHQGRGYASPYGGYDPQAYLQNKTTTIESLKQQRTYSSEKSRILPVHQPNVQHFSYGHTGYDPQAVTNHLHVQRMNHASNLRDLQLNYNAIKDDPSVDTLDK